MRSLRLISDSEKKTKEFGRTLGELFKGGEVIGLSGELGAGKTCFIQGMAEGLDVPKSEYVRSATFTIINEYKGRLPLYHFDLYRVESFKEIEDLGYEEYFWGKGICAVEWFEKIRGRVKKGLLEINIEVTDIDKRELHFYCKEGYYKQILKDLFKEVDGGNPG